MTNLSTSERLLALLKKRALILGRITLSNGSESNHYFDCKRVTLDYDGAELVGEAFLEAIQRLPKKPEAIGGLTTGADPIIGAVMMKARQRGLRLDGFYVRKERKAHGTRKGVENAPRPGAPVVIVDDVVTRGGSVLDAIQGAEDEGCKIVGVIALVDRLEGGTERIQRRVEHYTSLYTLDDFRSEIPDCDHPTVKSEMLSTGVFR